MTQWNAVNILFKQEIDMFKRLVFIACFLLIPFQLHAETWTLAGHSGKNTEEGLIFESVCPQARKTPKAPDEIYNLKNPLENSPENIFSGQTLFHFDVKPVPCRVCHGISGNGLGVLVRELSPGSRNFTCALTMDELPDGQLFWIIRNGSPGTAMPAFKNLADDQIWQLILYIRHFARKHS